VKKASIVKAQTIKKDVTKAVTAKPKHTAKAKKPIKSNISPIVKKKKIIVVKGNELNLFLDISKATIKTILSDFDIKTLALSLVGNKKDIVEKVTSAFGFNYGKRLKNAISKFVNPTVSEVKEARKIVEEKAREYMVELKSPSKK
ncbi:MAG: hypothetical protein HGB12_17405, partial [Bacteroidetes bacterium]|nr:hypothetical protein [Bacteroidota bacterium]